MRKTSFSIVLIGVLNCFAPSALFAQDSAKPGGLAMTPTAQDIQDTIDNLQAKFGEIEKARIERGVNQVARLWRPEDGSVGDFIKFCRGNFAVGKDLDAIFERFEGKLEQMGGAFNTLTLALRKQLDEDTGPLLPVDQMFAEFNPAAHLQEDMFRNKLAFLALLNFPAPGLDECLKNGEGWSRRQWAEVRLAQGYISRVPAEVT